MNSLFLAETFMLTPQTYSFWNTMMATPWWMKIVFAAAIISVISKVASANNK
jgi:hypothetical protein